MSALLSRCHVVPHGDKTAQIFAPDHATADALDARKWEWMGFGWISIHVDGEEVYKFDGWDYLRAWAKRCYALGKRPHGLRSQVLSHLPENLHHCLDGCDISSYDGWLQICATDREAAIALFMNLPDQFGPVLRGLGFEWLLITDPVDYVRKLSPSCCDLLLSWHLEQEADDREAMKAIAAAPISDVLREVLAGCEIEVMRYIGNCQPIDIQITTRSEETYATLVSFAWELAEYLPYAKYHLIHALKEEHPFTREYRTIPREELLTTHQQGRANLARLLGGV